MQQGVAAQAVVKVCQLLGGGQLPVDQQVADLDEAGLLRQLLNGVTTVAQDPCIPVDVGDRGLGGRGVHEARVVGDRAGGLQQRSHAQPLVAFGGRYHW